MPKKFPTITGLTNDYLALHKNPDVNAELVNSSDRAAVLIGATILDVQLERLLRGFFVDDEQEVNKLIASANQSAPLSSFSARIRAAYCLGLIHKSERDDLSAIREIRNVFAHNILNCTFDNSDVIKTCKNLTLFQTLLDEPACYTYRVKFNLVVIILESLILSRINDVQRRNPALQFKRGI
jgi:DNA-binding MltR family transcriptional regulator